MFDSTVLEVAAGLVFSFLAVSLATSALVEALASMTKWRSQTLLSGIKALMNDPGFGGLAKQLYGHALINPRGPGATAPKTNMPAYVDPQQFANALMDIIGLTSALARAHPSPTGATLVASLQSAVNTAVPADKNTQLNTMLQSIIQRSAGDADKIKKELASWFDNAMDRVSGVYKRISQLVGFVIALALCIVLNVDAVHISKALWAQPALVQAAKFGPTQPDPSKAIQTLRQNFPIGWPEGKWLSTPEAKDADGKPIPFSWLQAAIGWLITAFATLFGAPFWFDTLQSLTRLKGSGPSPSEKLSGAAASA